MLTEHQNSEFHVSAVSEMMSIICVTGGAGSDMTPLQKEVLDTAYARGQKEVSAELTGMWCDALALLLVSEWPAARKHLLAPLPQSTSVAIQAWMQARSLTPRVA